MPLRFLFVRFTGGRGGAEGVWEPSGSAPSLALKFHRTGHTPQILLGGLRFAPPPILGEMVKRPSFIAFL